MPELRLNTDDPRFGRHTIATFTRTHARFLSVGCPRCGAAPSTDCASMHRRVRSFQYPVRPHRERRQLAAEPRPRRRR